MMAEITSLFQTKKALQVISREEARRLIKEQRLQAIPSKVAFTVKAERRVVTVEGRRTESLPVGTLNFAQDGPEIALRPAVFH